MKKSLKMISLFLAVALLLCVPGCGGKEDDSGSPAPGGSTAQQPSADGAVDWHRDEQGRIEVVAANTQSLTSLDFMDGADGGMVQCMWDMIYDTLVDDATHEGDYQPRLATSWEHNDDSTEWTFHLREGVKFHNGNPFDAKDVACTMQRLMDKKGVLKRITGLWTYLDSYEVVDDYTIKLHFSQTYGTPMKDFSFMPMLDAEAYEELGDAYFHEGYLYGTGAWKFEEFVDGQYIRVVRNDSYWDPDWSSNVDVFTLRFITESSSMTSGLLSGEIDAVARIDSDQASLLKADSSLDVDLNDSTSFIFVGFQCGEDTPSPFKEENVRKAFSYAIDRQSIADNILGGGEAMQWWFPKGISGYREVETVYDPELAKQLLADSSYQGEELLFYVNTVATAGESIMLAVCDMVNAVGFNCKIQMGDQAFLTQVRTSPDYIGYCVTGTAFVDYGNDTYMKWVNTEENKGYYNQYADPDFAAMLEEMQATSDLEARDKIQADIAQHMYDHCAPAVPILRYAFNTCVRKGLQNVEFPPCGYYYYHDVYIG